MYQSLSIQSDGGESLKYNDPEFPVRCVYGDLSRFYKFTAGCHWHNDFEILLPTDGELQYFINGNVVTVEEGQGIFVNANRLHYGFSADQQECHYICLVFHPSIFGHPYIQKQIRRLSSDLVADYLIFEDRDMIRLVRETYSLFQSADQASAFSVLSNCCQLIQKVDQRLSEQPMEVISDSAWVSLRNMIGYLQMNYSQKVQLEQIAEAGMVCRSKCCQLFREKLNTTPISYLNHYRLEKAWELLIHADESVTEIARQCGFESPSYFTDQFRKVYGKTPREIQKNRKK